MNLRLLRLSFLSVLSTLPIALSTPSANGQVGSTGDTTATPVAGVGHSYIQSLNETVDPKDGSLSIMISAPIPQERGVNLPIYPFLYNSNSQPTPTPSWTSGQASNGAMYVTSVALATPQNSGPLNSVTQITNYINTYIAGQPASCTLYNNFVYTDPSGGRHSLGIQGTNNQAQLGCSGMGLSPSPEGTIVGDAQYTAIATNSGSFVRVYDLRGNELATNEDTHPGSNSSVEDANGNYLRPSGRSYTQSNGATNVPGLGGPYQLSYSTPFSSAFTFGSRGTTYAYPFNVYPLPSNGTECTRTFSGTAGGYSGTYYETLPNGQQYSLTVDPVFGLINHVTYPTGATVDYAWATNPQSQVLLGRQASPTPFESCDYIYDWPAVQSRILTVNGTKTQEQDYSYTTTWSGATWTTKTTTVKTTDYITTGHPSFKTVYTFSNHDVSHSTADTVATYDTAGTLLTTSYKIWGLTNQLAAECTTINGAGLTNGTFYTYSGIANLLTDKVEYDYGLVTSACTQPSSTPIRETKTVYQTFSSAPMIKNQPQTVQVYGNGVLNAETDYSYDEYSLYQLIDVPQILGHDETYYSTTSSRARGNATTIRQKCFVVSGGTCTDVVTHAQYDKSGQVVAAWDGNTNETQFSYKDNYTTDDGTPPSSGVTNTYVTKITHLPTNGVPHNTQFQYEFNGGKLRYEIDENSQTTTYCYWTNGCSGTKLDSWLRLTQTILPDGGGTTTNYTDSSPNAVVTSTTVATPDPSIVSQTTYDSLGRVTSTLATSAGNIETDTKYDGFGQVASVTNPYITTGDGTYGLTTYQYDSLGRKTIQTQPDGTSVLQWCYNGVRSSGQTNCTPRAGSKTSATWTDISDEVGNHSQNDFDGLGRLVSVLEPNASNVPALETDYQYNALDNLTQVDQWGGAVGSAGDHQRFFNYDSLSRLVAAYNPETGTTCYGTISASYPTFANCSEAYDGNGNLQYKTDARGLQTHFTYDVLNRLVSKIAPGINYSYSFDKDPNSSLTPKFPIGRMTYQSNGVNADRHYSYDAMGRTVLEEGTSPNNSGATANAVSATYDLAGAMTSMRYPDGRLVSLSYDAAARMTSVTDSTNSSAPIPYESSIQYSPIGQVSGADLGNGIGLLQSFDQTLRQHSKSYVGQVITCTKIGGCNPSLVNLWSKTYSWSASGNLLLATDNVVPVARQYTYDSLNRLASAQDIASSNSSSGQTTNTSDGSQDNALVSSQNLGGTYWGIGNSTISPNSATAPDGSLTAFTMTASSGSTNSSVAAYAPTPTLFDGAMVSASVWLKLPSGASSLSTTISIVNVGDNWATTNKSVTVTTSWQQFTIPPIVVQNGLVTLALQVGGSNTISAGQTVDIWGAELSVASAPDTNILPSSQQIGAAGWQISGGSITATGLGAPDGSNSASTATSTASNTIISDYVVNPGQYSGTTVTGSIYLCLPAGSAPQSVNLHLGNTTSSNTSTYLKTQSVPLTTTWQRFAISGLVPASTTQLWLQVGDQTPAFSSGQAISMWGAQMVVGSTDGTYVATTDTTTSPTGATEYLAANGLNESYLYDAFGNIRQSGNLTFEQAYTNTNRLSGWNYDLAGNLLSDQLGGNYIYDSNGMISADNGVAYYYDAMGNRVGKSGSSPTDTIYFDGRPMARLTGSVWTDLIYGPSGLLAENTGGSAGSLIYRMTDPLGSSIGTLSSTGTVMSKHDYAPFGQTFTGSSADPYQFTGKERDAESNNDYLGARYYTSNMGRFMSPDDGSDQDPSDPQSWNIYEYVRNNPLRFTDPDGHGCQTATTTASFAGGPITTTTTTDFSSCFDGTNWSAIGSAFQKATDVGSQVLHQAVNYLTASRDPGCMNRAVGAGTVLGAGFGTYTGAGIGSAGGFTLGLAGGGVMSVPAGIGGGIAGGTAGAVVGGGAGGALGSAFGYLACANGGGGGGRGSGSSARLTRGQQRQTAEHLGMKEVKGVTSQGQPVFEKGGRYFSFSNTSHNIGPDGAREVFKEVDRNGFRMYTTDINFNRIAP